MSKSIAFIDTEVGVSDNKIHDIGAVRGDGTVFHSQNIRDFLTFLAGCDYVCGHNIVHHDLKYLDQIVVSPLKQKAIDTLYLSPLLFPNRPYHALLKDDKLQVDELNNPLNDSQKAQKLFYDELNAFMALSPQDKRLFCCLLYPFKEFQGFFDYIGFTALPTNLPPLIRKEYAGRICANASLEPLIKCYPVELAYALALLKAKDPHSITPPWLLKNYPHIENVMKFLCNTPCSTGCAYCRSKLNIHTELKHFFGYDNFRTYNGEPLQERAAQAAVDGKSLLAVFPTGGGKSITFQLPALMAGSTVHGLTVVISPLQSLMKDQVDNLAANGITEAVTINGLMSPIERADACRRVLDGSAMLLYISPEQLRSRTIEKMLLSRNVVRFVIDEAHCFSAWGQDFRVDYLYIGDFIRELQKKKSNKKPIPVSCFTATAKQKVISDICEYFKRKLDVDLEIFASSAARENLHYTVLFKETNEEKYNALRNLIAQKNCPAIVYVSRTKRTLELAQKLTNDGYPALPFNGKMDPAEKIANQEAFIRNEVQIIVATSAFGMGVDKKDVKLVVHFDISDSLENYVQEAGRAGRDPSLQAECYVLYNDSDLDKHFILLNQTKLSISEIQQVWKAIKDLTRSRPEIQCSPLEIARQAGWDDTKMDVETRVKTAIAALETAGYIKRGRNVPHVYATGIMVKDMEEASARIERSALFSADQRLKAKRIIKSLISSRSISNAGNDDAESRVDYLADTLGMTKDEVIGCISLMRQDGLLADSQDMSAYILKSDTQNRSMHVLDRFAKLEQFVLEQLPKYNGYLDLKKLNEAALDAGISTSSVKDIRTILYFLTIKNYIQKVENKSTGNLETVMALDESNVMAKFRRRIELSRFALQELFSKANALPEVGRDETPVLFSLVSLFQDYTAQLRINSRDPVVTLQDVEDALLYLSKIGALKLEGGFLVTYNGLEIKRIVMDNKIKYKVDDYRLLDDFYKQRIRQIHIVGEYANLMVRDYDQALQFVQDYFQMDFRKFIAKYFKGDRAKDIDRNITPEKYHQLFGELSDIQSQIISDSESKFIVVAAGPGSGKTRVLVHKLAALLLMEDVKHEQLLMLTFSRAAATEFKQRLYSLIGSAAAYVEIKTFHSYCFDLLGKVGSLEGVENVVKNATELIRNGEVEPGRIMKSVMVIDEAQDMDEDEFALIQAIMQVNDDIRLIAVGDDDQNIYEFRGSDSKHLRSLIETYGATRYEMTENYRSRKNIVALSNAFAQTIHDRMKHTPIVAMNGEDGTVLITRHSCRHMEEAVAEQIVQTHQGCSACVLTTTNDEALQMLGLLQKKGLRAKLIQSLDGFSLYNLSEIRYFLRIIDKGLKTPVIPKELWHKAKAQTLAAYAASNCVEILNNLWRSFETTNDTMYRTDLEEFIRESNYDDFYDDDGESIFVSTIHKSKGREFDTVWMLLNNVQAQTDEVKRKIYVGMTRAKEALYIHCNTDLLDSFHIPGVRIIQDQRIYDAPQEISLQLTHRDVVLDFFKGKKEIILKLRSGDSLNFTHTYFTTEINGRTVWIAKVSKGFSERLEQLRSKGFEVESAAVRFVVAWKGENDDSETAVVLLDLRLKATSGK